MVFPFHSQTLFSDEEDDDSGAHGYSELDISRFVSAGISEFNTRTGFGPITPRTEPTASTSVVSSGNKISRKKAKASEKRRVRRNKLKTQKSGTQSSTAHSENNTTTVHNSDPQTSQNSNEKTNENNDTPVEEDPEENIFSEIFDPESGLVLKPLHIKMSDIKSREEILAARQLKKQLKLKGGRGKEAMETAGKPAETKKAVPEQGGSSPVLPQGASGSDSKPMPPRPKENFPRSKDEVDKARIMVRVRTIGEDECNEIIMADAAAVKAAKEAKLAKVPLVKVKTPMGKLEKPIANIQIPLVKAETPLPKVATPLPKVATPLPKVATPLAKVQTPVLKVETPVVKVETPVAKGETLVAKNEAASKPVNEDMTVKDVVVTLKEIVTVAKNIKDVTEKVSAIDLSGKKPTQQQQPIKDKPEEGAKSKAELKAERRAKQDAQRAAKQTAAEQKVTAKPKTETKAILDRSTPTKEDKAPKQKSPEKAKPKSQSAHRVNWFQHLYKEQDKEPLKSIAINSHLHPAIIQLGVQLASRVVSGSNARCIALLDALKKMVRDYTLPAKTEFARGLEASLASSLVFLWSMRPPSASQTNAVKFFRYHLTQLPNNVDEFDAKKTLQEEIDRYIREQIDMAGEAISIAVRNKISNGDTILTYGCSSLIERILREAWSAGVHFHTIVVGNRVHGAATQMLQRLTAHGLPCTYVDITALSFVMNTVNKVILGAGALLVNGSVLGALGSAQTALAARARNVPVLVACETHKFSERVQTDAFVYNEIGDPDELIDKSDDNSPLKDWRSNQNLTPLNLTYDVTPASLVTAVVTELAILPCTSAPVVLRFKLSEYGV